MPRRKREELRVDLIAEGGVEEVVAQETASGDDEGSKVERSPRYSRPSGFLVSHRDFKHLCPGMTAKQIARLSDRGDFVPYIRISKQSEPMYSAAAVRDWFAKKYEPIGGLESVTSRPLTKKREEWFDPIGPEGMPDLDGDKD
jgi:hypothetical protein